MDEKNHPTITIKGDVSKILYIKKYGHDRAIDGSSDP